MCFHFSIMNLTDLVGIETWKTYFLKIKWSSVQPNCKYNRKLKDLYIKYNL